MKYNVCSFASEAEFEKQANQGDEGGWALHSWHPHLVMVPDNRNESALPLIPVMRFFAVFIQTNPEAVGAKVDERKPIGAR